MADEILRSKHAFGNSADVMTALEKGLIDEYDILFMDGVTEPKVGWVDKDKNIRIVDTEKVILVNGDSLPESGVKGKLYIFDEVGYYWDGKEFKSLSKSADLSELESAISALETEVAKKANAEDVETKIEDALSEVEKTYTKIEYEIFDKPEGTIVNYYDKEIRVMCPADTEWVLRQSGANADQNAYYIGFKAYAPNEDVMSFKEDLSETITDTTMYYFENNDFAGIDDYGRKYSIVWLATAVYDATTDTWTYYGAKSSKDKYIGWYYSVEWYDANDVMVASDCIRINLSNEDCHSSVEPYYVARALVSAKEYTDTQIEEKMAELESAYGIVEF